MSSHAVSDPGTIESRYLTRPEAAQRLGCSVKTVDRLVHDRALTVRRTGRGGYYVRIAESSIEEYLRRGVRPRKEHLKDRMSVLLTRVDEALERQRSAVDELSAVRRAIVQDVAS